MLRPSMCRRQQQQRDFVALFQSWVSNGAQPSLSTATETMGPGTLFKPVIVVSACLLGRPVAYHGGAARLRVEPLGLRFIRDILWTQLQLVDLVPFCPEMQLAGLPAPRSPLRLVRRDATGELDLVDATRNKRVPFERPPVKGVRSSVRIIGHDSRTPMIAGMILRSRSPSCGIGDVRIRTTRTTREKGSCDEEDTSCDGFFVHTWVRQIAAEQQATLTAHSVGCVAEAGLVIASERHLRVVHLGDTVLEGGSVELQRPFYVARSASEFLFRVQSIYQRLLPVVSTEQHLDTELHRS